MSTNLKKTKATLTLLRPYSWIKNILVFAPLFFARGFFNTTQITLAAATFIAFCITASLVYVLNDIVDYQSDRAHKTKQYRPIAAGVISKKEAAMVAVVLAVLLIWLCMHLPPAVTIVIGIYVVLNVLYSLYLKHVVIVDLFLICCFYLARIIAGGAAVGVPVSLWLILCTAFAALFLASGKRRAELRHEHQRKVLSEYSPELVTGIAVSAGTATIIAYSLYAVTILGSDLALYSVLFVTFAVLRYLALIYRSSDTEYPERALFKDPWIATALLVWVIIMYLILYR